MVARRCGFLTQIVISVVATLVLYHIITSSLCGKTGELCQALQCRKEERCLLENAYTAVCVSRTELKKNG